MKKLNGLQLKDMVKSGAANLENHLNEINALNVFPVPDGDTGTNMFMTFSNGTKEANNCFSNDIGAVAKALSKGLLMGARGNSGVILSQIFRGFAKSIDGKEEVDAEELAEAFENGARVAYKAIMKPVEGTILTVVREATWYAHHDFKAQPKITIEEYFNNLLKYMNESLERTPDLLPILKEANVVDSGGAGLCKIVEGFVAYINGKPIETIATVEVNSQQEEEFGYCVEFIETLNDPKNFDLEKVKGKLVNNGEAVVAVKDENVLKVHVHTLHPGDILNIGQRYGEFKKIKVENISEGHSELITKEDVRPKKESKAIGIIAVGAGEGITNLLYELGVDEVISGGQTMNPSTQDFIEKIDLLDNCEKIFLFPNNSNIILAANQAASMYKDKEVTVVNCKSVQACISALAFFSSEASFADNLNTFNETIGKVTTANITYAVKDTNFEGVDVKEGDYMAIEGKTIVSSGDDLLEVAKKLINTTVNDDHELVTIITGVDSKKEDTDKIVAYIEENTDLEATVIDGGVPVYYYLFGLE